MAMFKVILFHWQIITITIRDMFSVYVEIYGF